MIDEKTRRDQVQNLIQEESLEESQLTEKISESKTRKKPEYALENLQLTVGQLIGAQRRSFGWTQEELAWRSGVSVTQISRIERDLSDPMIDSIEGLENALGIDLYDLFMEQKRKKRKGKHKKKGIRIAGNALGEFERELAKKSVSDCDLKDVLDEALKSVDSRVKNKK